MKDYDAIAREVIQAYNHNANGNPLEAAAAILRKHDEAEADGEADWFKEQFLAFRKGKTLIIGNFRDDYKIPQSAFFVEVEAARSVVRALLAARSAPTDEKALRGEWLNAKTNPPRDAKKQVCINRNGGAFFARYAGGDWLDDDALLRDPVLYISIPLLAREAPKDESKEGGA